MASSINSSLTSLTDDCQVRHKLLKPSKPKGHGAAQVASELHLKNLDERKDVAMRMPKPSNVKVV